MLGHMIQVIDVSEKVNINKLIGVLTFREFEVFTEMVKGKTNKEIAKTLYISSSTVKAYLSFIIEKLQAKNRTDAVVKGVLFCQDQYEIIP